MSTTPASAMGGNGSPIELPLLEGQRTLIIGLGSTGTMVCNQILERVSWTYDSPRNLPWLRCICLETARVAQERLVHKYARFLHLKIPKEEYARILEHPDQFQDAIGFQDWKISTVLGGADSVVDGANGLRLLGRLALLLPQNYQNVIQAIREALDELRQLTTQEAGKRYKDGTGEDYQIALSSTIHVYVVGTLCGGTASGTFIDLGYILERLPGYNLLTTGIFTLPSLQEDDTVRIANAVTALVELNHFSSNETRYQQQFSDTPRNVYSATTGQRPYRYLYTVQTRGGGSDEYPRLLTTIADYLYTDLAGGNSTARDGKRADVSEFFVETDNYGAPQKFLTFGMSVLEFPYIKVLKACTIRLLTRGFQLRLGDGGVTEADKQKALASAQLLRQEALVTRLLKSTSGKSLLDEFRDAVYSIEDRLHLDEAAAYDIESQLDKAFDGEPQGQHPRLGARIVPTTLETNAQLTQKELEDSLSNVVRTCLLGKDAVGLHALQEILNEVVTLLNKPLSATRQDILEGYQQEMRDALTSLQDCSKDPFLAITLQKKKAMKIYANQYLESAVSYYQERLKQQTVATAQAVREDVVAFVNTILHRLNNPVGLEADVLHWINQSKALYNRTDIVNSTDPWERSVNGTELFLQGATINQEYAVAMEDIAVKRNLRGKADSVEKQIAQEIVDPFFVEAVEAVLGPVARTLRFDAQPGKILRPPTDDRLLEEARRGRPYFAALAVRPVSDRLIERSDMPTLLTDLKNKGQLFLQSTFGPPRYRDHNRKSYGFVFLSSKTSSGQQVRETLNQINVFEGIQGDTRISDTSDLHQIVFLREHGAFSLGILNPLMNSNSPWWYYYKPQEATRHARGDIKEWLEWAPETNRERMRLRTLFLVGVATKVITFETVSRYTFRYEPANARDSGLLTFGNDLAENARLLQNAGSVVTAQLQKKIREFQENGALVEGVADAMFQEVKRCQDIQRNNPNGALFRIADKPVTAQQMEDAFREYAAQDEKLRRAFHEFFPQTDVEQYWRGNGYYCNQCNSLLGYTPDALKTLKYIGNKLVEVRECAVCGNSTR